ncbi:MAG: hypothetical protein Kow0010_01660 [Dehalococcoidia bacterium]
MPKTIAITPSWYWPAGIPRVMGVPPFSVYDLCVARPARDRPDDLAVVAGDQRLTFMELKDAVDRAAAAVAERSAGARGGAAISPRVDIESAFLLLGALAAGIPLRLVPPGGNLAAVAESVGATVLEGMNGSAGPAAAKRFARDELQQPAVTVDGVEGPVHHSHRSLLAMAISLSTYFDAGRRPWLVTLPPWRWEGLVSLLTPLYLGAPAVLLPEQANEAALAEIIAREEVGYAFHELEPAAYATREAKKEVKQARGLLEGFLLSVHGIFDSDQRRRVARGFECPALTVFGLPETGPIFAAHPSWYLDESVGTPMTNAHVVPAEPRTGAPIPTLWELVESAEVTLSSPSLMCGYERDAYRDRFVDGRYRTKMMASSDPNGMIYLLGE